MSRERQHFCHKGSFIFVEASFYDQLATILWEVTIQWTGPQVKRKGTGSFLLYSCPFPFPGSTKLLTLTFCEAQTCPGGSSW